MRCVCPEPATLTARRTNAVDFSFYATFNSPKGGLYCGAGLSIHQCAGKKQLPMLRFDLV